MEGPDQLKVKSLLILWDSIHILTHTLSNLSRLLWFQHTFFKFYLIVCFTSSSCIITYLFSAFWKCIWKLLCLVYPGNIFFFKLHCVEQNSYEFERYMWDICFLWFFPSSLVETLLLFFRFLFTSKNFSCFCSSYAAVFYKFYLLLYLLISIFPFKIII